MSRQRLPTQHASASTWRRGYGRESSIRWPPEGGFIPLHAPVEEFVEAAKGTDCQILGAIESLRPATEEESVNAIASRLYEGGASGLYLFNFWHKSADWKSRVLNVLTNPDQLSRATKRYEMEYMERLTPNDLHSYAFRYAVPCSAASGRSGLQPDRVEGR